jgi:chromosome partitioning protein
MARIVVFGNEKGGSGKSTTALHVLIAMCYENKKVGVLDLDIRQKTLFTFLKNREKYCFDNNMKLSKPEIYKVRPSEKDSKLESNLEEEKNFATALNSLERKCDFIIIDCPGGFSNYVKMAHTVADTLVTPMNDSFIDFDLLATEDGKNGKVFVPSIYSEMVWTSKKLRASAKHPPIDWIVCRNRVSQLYNRNKYHVGKSLAALSKKIGFRVSTGLSERVIYRELFLSGLTLLDLEKVGDWKPNMSHISAKQEIRVLMDSLDLY